MLLWCAIFVPSCMVGIVLGHQVRRAGMHSFVERSRPLVEAIERYEHAHSAPPPSLQALVPRHLAAVPSTGMMAYPRYRYFTGEEAKDQYLGNAWALAVFTPGAGINFDMILYLPSQNYPEIGFGGSLEHIGDWAYVHE
jgi:hypothetical protein